MAIRCVCRSSNPVQRKPEAILSCAICSLSLCSVASQAPKERKAGRPGSEAAVANQTADVVVAARGWQRQPHQYTTVAAAIAAAPANSDKRHVIHIKRGVYKEFVVVGQEKRNVVLVGDGMDATVISGSRCCADGYDTPGTAVLSVQGNGFIARDLCIENTAGPRKENGQAVALLSQSDQSVLYRCALRGYQDTLWCASPSSKQLYRECTISGTVDFVFGDAAAVFQSCDIRARLPMQGQENTITAQGRDRADSDGGFCFQSCTVAADEDLAARGAVVQTYLGRPWKPFSRVVFMQCTVSDVVDPRGWLPWERQVPPDTLYYGEYGNEGPGAAVGGRVNWRGVHSNLDASEACSFTVERFIKGNDWLPSTGVEYKPGL
ncbi:pectinesterase-like [Setaria viridis]|uniref:pectinesterase-like n=1 Tax=Setaria viridis TaxID=4556 RepID=UPI001493B303|nr:probable pectinesterase 56 isoform X2 [Setaria viridis]